MSKRTNRVKYNSWYTKLEQRNMFSNSQQPTLEAQPARETKGGQDESSEESIKIEDVKDEEFEEGEESYMEQRGRIDIQSSIVNSNIQESNPFDSSLDNTTLRIKQPEKLSASGVKLDTGASPKTQQSFFFGDRRVSGGNTAASSNKSKKPIPNPNNSKPLVT